MTITRTYHKNGAVCDETIENGNIKIYKLYDDDGALRLDSHQKNGVPHGIERWFNKGGNLHYEFPYKNGNLQGLKKAWNSDGRLCYAYSFQDDKHHGLCKDWEESGKTNERFYFEGKSVSKEEFEKLLPANYVAKNEEPCIVCRRMKDIGLKCWNCDSKE